MQAAGGASLSDATDIDQNTHRPDPSVPSRRRALILLAGLSALLYAADQVTKILAVDRLPGEPDRPLIGEVLQLRLAYNTGAAFSAGEGYTEVLSAVAIVAVLVICWLIRRVRSLLWAVAMGSLLAGVSGNLTDRLLREPGPMRGAVVDFLMLPNWPIFNIADVCINVAAGLILIQAFRGVRLDGARVKDAS